MSSALPGDDEEEVLVLEGLGQRRVFTRRSVKHMIVGGLLGFMLSLTLTSILYEIARDTAFAVVDVLLLLAAAVALFMKHYRAAKHFVGANPQHQGAQSSMLTVDESPESRMLAVVRIGALLVGTAAVCVILVIATSLPPVAKFFLVLNISAAHCYLMCLSSVEFFNYFFNEGAPLIARQLYTVVIASLAVGCLSGVLFGLADVERNFEELAWEEWVAAALCILSGAAVGHANSTAVDDSMELAFEPDVLNMDEGTDSNAAAAAVAGSPAAGSPSAAGGGTFVFNDDEGAA